MALTDSYLRQTKPSDRPIKKADDKGLFILIQPTGAKWWRFRYRFAGKEKLLSLGTYPEVTLSQARVTRDELRSLVARGIDPSAQRKATKEATADTFTAIFHEWFAKQSQIWNESHAKRNRERFDNHLKPYIGSTPVRDITPVAVLSVLNRIEEKGHAETAHRVKQIVGMTMRYSVATGRADSDPTASLKGALPPTRKRHHPALLDPAKIGETLRLLYGYVATPPVMAAIRLGPMLFCRPGELRHMEWADLDIDLCEWRFTLSKTHQPHIVVQGPSAM